MSQQDAVALKGKIINKRQAKVMQSTISSIDALPMISHGSELSFDLMTPIGTHISSKANFIGCHTNQYILMEMPEVQGDDKTYFFQEGFWMEVCAISSRGRGAHLTFKSQLIHLIESPVQLLLLSIPQTMQIYQLRKEPRYEVALMAQAITNNYKFECQIHDLSRGGCRVVTSLLNQKLTIGDKVVISVTHKGKNLTDSALLIGEVCNLQSSVNHSQYGLKFSEEGQNNAKVLLSKLKFDGTKLAIMNAS
ncbi:cation tolerance protein CutA [Psychromonas sp. psych-6C06]|uniref:PilZ domain-containing protein n=1 Tax=Psychromonas sp. psych-6C06 TaxID=2058089 RepID=UPI000C33ED03|nr:PilZ domain-containing protein [Psychromonas sp. psych-6C06]PKF61128.1 cation tolerance protein CutA [Psychromonas sp. psych-6C06]